MELEFNLPNPLVFTLADPLILFNGRLLQPGKKTDGTNENYLQLNASRYALEEIEPPKGLEELYFSKYGDRIENIQRDYLRTKINSSYINRNDIEKELGENKVMSLLVTKILPVVTNFGLDDELSRLVEQEIGVTHNANFIEFMAGSGNSQSRSRRASGDSEITQGDIRREKRTLSEMINKEYERFEVQKERERRNADEVLFEQLIQAIDRTRGQVSDESSDMASILSSQIFPERNIMLYNKGIYDLVTYKDWFKAFRNYIDPQLYRRLQRISSSRKPEEIFELLKENKSYVEKRKFSRLIYKIISSQIKINGNYYYPILNKEESFETAVNHYKKLIEKEVKLRALDHNEFQSIQMSEVVKQREMLSRIVDLNRFEHNGAGFEKHDGRYYAYATTPAFALKSPHIRGDRKYIAFPPAKIGVGIWYDRQSRNICLDNPQVMNSYKHPFLSSDRGSMQYICLGQYDPSHAKRLPPEQGVLELLSKAKENLMMGYKSGRNPYRPLTEGYWNAWKTKAEIDEKKLVCLNDYSGRRR